MQQSSTIAFFLLAGFVVYITIKGELPAYAGVLGIGSGGTVATSNTIGSTSSEFLNLLSQQD